MRAIDADALKKHAMEMEVFMPYGGDGSTMAVHVSTIDVAPTLDYAPVVHGKWDDNIVPFCNVCSVCKVYVDRGCFPTVRHKGIVLPNIGALNYCPNCGARMDGKEHDNG